MSRLRVPVRHEDHRRGPLDAIALVEYGDYECPACGDAQPVVDAALDALGDGVCFVYRNFPLAEIHPHALAAAEAAECAADLGDFWGMHDLLFAHQDQLGLDDLARYAAWLRLDVDRFVAAVTGHALLARVRDDFRGGVRSGVNGTPTFFIDGARYDGPLGVDELVEAVERSAAMR